MRRITSFLAAFLSLMTFTCASEVSLSDVERAMMTLVDQVRGEQTLIFPHIRTPLPRVKSSDYDFVKSVLTAVVPGNELEEAKKDPEGFARIPFSQRSWYEGLPADVKEYLRAVEKAEGEIIQRTQKPEKGGQYRFRGVGWWWESRGLPQFRQER